MRAPWVYAPLLLLVASRALAAVPAFSCPLSAQVNTSCLCTSGCSVNDEFSYPWSPPVYPPPSTPLGKDTICATVTLPCSTAASALASYLGVNGYVRGDASSGYHYFQGCADGALVTTFSGLTEGECEQLRILYVALAATDPTGTYSPPQLCTTDNCNVVLGGGAGSVAGTSCPASAGERAGTGAARLALALAAAVVAAAVDWS